MLFKLFDAFDSTLGSGKIPIEKAMHCSAFYLDFKNNFGLAHLTLKMHTFFASVNGLSQLCYNNDKTAVAFCTLVVYKSKTTFKNSKY
jgi:hypothetical protein